LQERLASEDLRVGILDPLPHDVFVGQVECVSQIKQAGDQSGWGRRSSGTGDEALNGRWYPKWTLPLWELILPSTSDKDGPGIHGLKRVSLLRFFRVCRLKMKFPPRSGLTEKATKIRRMAAAAASSTTHNHHPQLLTRETSCVGLTNRNATSTQISVIAI
jgi:hypothetical protein